MPVATVSGSGLKTIPSKFHPGWTYNTDDKTLPVPLMNALKAANTAVKKFEEAFLSSSEATLYVLFFVTLFYPNNPFVDK